MELPFPRTSLHLYTERKSNKASHHISSSFIPSQDSLFLLINMEQLIPTLSSTCPPPPSPSPSTQKWTFDVFLSFRGEDTRYGFTGYLCDALRDKGIHNFIDDRLHRGEEITTALLEAIEKSRIAVVILSVNYASSAFCLEELVKILECREQKGQSVLPIFYKVDPSDVRHIRESYGDALAKHEAKFKNEEEKVQKWKSALREVANLSGFHFKGDGYEYEFVKKIIGEICKRINHTSLNIARYPVGLESRVKDVISLLNFDCDKKVVMVGIYGIGGIGKTTIAYAVHDVIFDQFESVCSLSDVRERSDKYGLVELQQALLLKLNKEKEIVENVREGISIISRRLHQKKVLLILDDVDSQKQLEALAGRVDWFGFGSRIIITTRDKHLLDVHGVDKYYNLNGLCPAEALELFSWNAFKKKEVESSYASVLDRAINYCKGLPLALEILGSNLFNKTQEEWKSALDTYEKIPDKNIQNILRISFDGLEEREREIFLDIACFFKGCQWDDVKDKLLNVRGYNLEYHIGVLMEKSLISFVEPWVQIHDLIVQMGKEIVRSGSSSNPGNWSRLCGDEDILCVLEEDKGTDKIEVLKFNMSQNKEVLWNGEAFKKMKNLKMLEIRGAHFSCRPKYLPNSLRVLQWAMYPSSSLPSEFHPRNLAILNLQWSSLRSIKPFNVSLRSIKPFNNFKSLTVMNLMGNRFLKQVPDVSGAVNLRELDVSYCQNLIEVHSSVGFLDKLVKLDAYGCTNLSIFPHSINLASLELLILSRCFSLQNFPQVTGVVKNLKTTDFEINLNLMTSYIYGANLVLKQSKDGLVLECGSLMLPVLDKWKDGFQRLSSDDDNQERANPKVPVTLCVGEDESKRMFLTDEYFSTYRPYYSSLTNLILENCELTDEFLHQRLPWFPHLDYLNVKGNKFTILPECLNECRCLETLLLDYCKDLQEIKGIPPYVKIFSTVDCISLTSQSSSKLLSQDFHANGVREVNVPGIRIPKWLDHCCIGSSISFWCRKKFPRIALCCVHLTFNFLNIDIFINGIRVSRSMPCLVSSCASCISLFDVDERWDNEEGKIEFREKEWNLVEVSVATEPDNNDYIYMMGVHVYKEEIGRDNVRFIDPNPLKRTHATGHSLDLITLSKEFCPFLGMQVCDRIDSRKKNEYNYRFLNPDGFCSLFPGEIGLCTYKAIWIMEAPTTVKVLLWNILDKSLPTFENLYFEGFVNDSVCPICETEVETTEHVFLECPSTRPIWFGSGFGWILKYKWILKHQSILEDKDNQRYAYRFLMKFWLEDRFKDIEEVQPHNARRVRGLLGNIFWTIWKGRNEFVVSGKPVDPWEALRTAKAIHKRYCSIFSLLETYIGPADMSTNTTYQDSQHNEHLTPINSENVIDIEILRKPLLSNCNTEIEPTCDKDLQHNKDFTPVNSENVKGIEVERKVNQKVKLVRNSNIEIEPTCDEGTEDKRNPKRRRKGESSSNTKVEYKCDKESPHE